MSLVVKSIYLTSRYSIQRACRMFSKCRGGLVSLLAWSKVHQPHWALDHAMKEWPQTQPTQTLFHRPLRPLPQPSKGRKPCREETEGLKITWSFQMIQNRLLNNKGDKLQHFFFSPFFFGIIKSSLQRQCNVFVTVIILSFIYNLAMHVK